MLKEQAVDGDKEEMKKKIIYAVLMAGLMIATVFSAISVNATSNNQQQEIESEPFGDGIATLKVRVYYDLNDNGEWDSDESIATGAQVSVVINELNHVREKIKMTDDNGRATFHYIVFDGETSLTISWVVAKIGIPTKWLGDLYEPFEITSGETKKVFIGLIARESIQLSSATVNPSLSQQSTTVNSMPSTPTNR